MERVKSFRHLRHDDRIKIESLAANGCTVKTIAVYIGCSQSTIYRELQRGKYLRTRSDLTQFTAYSADIAQQDYNEKAKNKGIPLKIGHAHTLADFIEDQIIDNNYSPAAALEKARKDKNKFYVNFTLKTLYNYIDQGIFFRLTNKDLPRKKEIKRPYRKVHTVRTKRPLCRSIEERPAIIETREEFGHWEMDTVYGKRQGSGEALLVLTERKTRQEFILKMKSKTAEETVKALNRLERKLGAEFRRIFKTITIDNGGEFMDTTAMEQSCRTKGKRTTVYYCHPYSSWERGSNENANSLIRRFIPKGTPIENYSHNQIEHIQDWINDYPRKILGYLTSNDLYQKELEEI